MNGSVLGGSVVKTILLRVGLKSHDLAMRMEEQWALERTLLIINFSFFSTCIANV